MEILLPRMNYTHEIVGTHGGGLLPERAFGAWPWRKTKKQHLSRVSALTWAANVSKIRAYTQLVSQHNTHNTTHHFD